MLQIACAEMGFDCGAVFKGKNQQELEVELHKHAIAVHGLEEADFTPELMRKLKGFIRRS